MSYRNIGAEISSRKIVGCKNEKEKREGDKKE
jgi:hypothetical protein